GVYSPALVSGSMHGPVPPLDVVYYGHSDSVLYLRLDLNRVFLQSHPEFEIRLALEGAERLRLQAHVRHAELRATELWKDDAAVARESLGDSFEIALGSILELRADYSLLGVNSNEYLRLQVAVWENAIPIQVLPQDGWLSVRLQTESINW
ncbi:MAG TPA: hypothetical protein VI455_20730, partial [Terriglobia bacterium]